MTPILLTCLISWNVVQLLILGRQSRMIRDLRETQGALVLSVSLLIQSNKNNTQVAQRLTNLVHEQGFPSEGMGKAVN